MNACAKRRLCAGCRNEIYNNPNSNPSGTSECWSLATAEVVRMKLVHINDAPPWKHRPQRVLSCYSRPQYVKVAPDQTC